MRDTDDEWLNKRRRERREYALNKALTALRLIAKGLGAEDPRAEAEKTKRTLLRRIENEKAARLRYQRYGARIEPWRSAVEKPNKRWACHLVRLETNRRSVGRLRGPHPLSRKKAIERAINNAASVRAEELTPVERRAVEMLERGEKKQRVKSRKNILEKRALCLAESVRRKWFPNKHKSKAGANHDVDRPILLSITDVISIAVPIIEEFAKGPIAFRKRESDPNPPSSEALYWIVVAHAKDNARCKKSTVKRLLSRVQGQADAPIAQDQDLRIDIAPELLGDSSTKTKR